MSEQPPISVLIADDHELVRAALRTMLGRRADIQVVGEVSDGQQAVAAASALRPDVILMDVRMPGMTGVEATRRILGDWPHPGPRPRVLVLTTFDLDEYVHAALRAGASGFILKNNSPDQLIEAIRVIATGEAMLAPAVTRRLINAFATLPPTLVSGQARAASESDRDPDRPGAADPLGVLTERERSVALLVAVGLSNAQIARRLNLSEASVKSSVNRLLNRLNLENRVQVAILVHSTGLAPKQPPA
ncbi:response regulator [Actinomadura sp. 6N118]|uniref:response regulator transcription factor n=1 Tax=Actinomadura sp. 6N118 TaxID=3375151 RepID=UPI0037A1ACDF